MKRALAGELGSKLSVATHGVCVDAFTMHSPEEDMTGLPAWNKMALCKLELVVVVKKNYCRFEGGGKLTGCTQE